MHRYTFNSPFAFGDRIKFDSQHTSGEGIILDIVLSNGGSVYYIVLRDDGDAEGGIYPEHASLIVSDPAS